MDLKSNFDTLWTKTLAESERDGVACCEVKRDFQDLVRDLIWKPLKPDATPDQIAQAKYLLTEKWQEWRRALPGRHSRKTASHHQCIDGVYQDAYDRLHRMDLQSRPPIKLLLDHYKAASPHRAALATPKIAGIFLGETS